MPAALTPHTLTEKVELTDSGKFIEVEKEAGAQEKTVEVAKVESDLGKAAPAPQKTPNQSPGKSVRIKENGAKANGGAVDSAKVPCLDFAFRMLF